MAYQRPKAPSKTDKTAAKSALPALLYTTQVDLYKTYVHFTGCLRHNGAIFLSLDERRRVPSDGFLSRTHPITACHSLAFTL